MKLKSNVLRRVLNTEQVFSVLALVVSLVDVVRLDQRQNMFFQFIANKLDVVCFSLVVNHSGLRQFREMSMVKCDPDAMSMLVGYSLRFFVSNPVCNAVYERIVFQRPIGSAVQ